jgi:hypothetical protein
MKATGPQLRGSPASNGNDLRALPTNRYAKIDPPIERRPASLGSDRLCIADLIVWADKIVTE